MSLTSKSTWRRTAKNRIHKTVAREESQGKKYINCNRNGHTCAIYTRGTWSNKTRAPLPSPRKASPPPSYFPFECGQSVDGVESTVSVPSASLSLEVQWPVVRFNRGKKRLRASRPRGKRHARDFVNVHAHRRICSPFVLIS